MFHFIFIWDQKKTNQQNKAERLINTESKLKAASKEVGGEMGEEGKREVAGTNF